MEFIIDDNIALTYEDLIDCANNGAHSGKLEIPQVGILEFSKKFFSGIANSCDLEILPDGLKSNPNKEEENSPSKRIFEGIEDFLDAVMASSSKIYIYTSGTTGRPKRALHTIKTLTRNVKIGGKHAKDKWGFCYAPSHMAGIQVLLQAFFNKNTCVNLFGKTRSQIYSEIEKRAITHISATPTFYRLLLPCVKIFPNVECATFGGERSSKQLYESISKIFPNAKITNVYASTEVGALLASEADIFKIPPGLKGLVKIDNGELAIHKSLLALSDDTPLSGDFYKTGDAVEFADTDKMSFRFTGRIGNFINVGGYKVNPEEVEDSIKSLDGVREAIVFGKPNSLLGNILCAEISIIPAAKVSESDIRTSLLKLLPQFKIPRIISFTDSIRLTRTGKIKRV